MSMAWAKRHRSTIRASILHRASRLARVNGMAPGQQPEAFLGLLMKWEFITTLCLRRRSNQFIRRVALGNVPQLPGRNAFNRLLVWLAGGKAMGARPMPSARITAL